MNREKVSSHNSNSGNSFSLELNNLADLTPEEVITRKKGTIRSLKVRNTVGNINCPNLGFKRLKNVKNYKVHSQTCVDGHL